MARSRTFDPTEALEGALHVFWEKGYQATSVADVVKRTGVARYGLYQAFGDKDDLYRAALARYKIMVRDEMLAGLKVTGAGLDAIHAHFGKLQTAMQNGDKKGCLACLAAIERAEEDPEVAKIVTDTITEMKVAFAHALGNALSRGEVRKLPLSDLTEYLVGLQRSLATMVRSNTPTEDITNHLRCAMALLKA